MKPLSVSNWSRPRSPVTSAPQKSARACGKALVAKLSGTETYDDELTTASNAAIDLIHDDKLNEAEAAARNLLVRYPEVPDGWDRLGMVHEKRGENRQAADCYRKLIAFVREHLDDFDAEIADEYAARVATLDPPAAG
jgi:tetratricopeptide (TPR) repeat protein